jgi:hypothetical protein
MRMTYTLTYKDSLSISMGLFAQVRYLEKKHGHYGFGFKTVANGLSRHYFGCSIGKNGSKSSDVGGKNQDFV